MMFWAKTDSDGNPWISVFDHLLNVGHVAKCLAKGHLRFVSQFDLDVNVIAALSALHDIGKISPGFQRKSCKWLTDNNLDIFDRNCNWKNILEPDHSLVSQAFLQRFLCEQGIPKNIAKYVACALGAHHGKMKALPTRNVVTKDIAESRSGIGWDQERQACSEAVMAHFGAALSLDAYSKDSPVLWWLAGLTSIADWIGSDERFFSSTSSTSNPATSAKLALETIGLSPFSVRQNLAFHDLFYDQNHPDHIWSPNDMQQTVYDAINGPGVYVIEAPMGLGKTEAALWVAYKLLSTQQATGIYFALPTQATSNRMYLRFQSFLERIVLEAQISHLIHGNSWLRDKNPVLDPGLTMTDSLGAKGDDASSGQEWFSSSKRALIASFGVGTIDQALLEVVAAKHFFVRHFALAGKVVILDEVHAYDIYTKTLIDKLVTTLEGLGCTVLILSATLGEDQLKTLSDSPGESDEDLLPYPYISGRCQGQSIVPRHVELPESKSVQVVFVDHSEAQNQAVALAKEGGVVLWICNTVDEAQFRYREFKAGVDGSFPIGLLHSRFPYWRREALESEWMTRLGKDGKTRCGTILISTQICEQSVDLDADLLITELAPTDMLLQRIGRLWRHSRDFRPIKAPFVYILKESVSFEVLREKTAAEIVSVLGSKAKVYSPYILIKTLDVWLKRQGCNVSLPNDIRLLIRDTYKDNLEHEPLAWQKLFEDWYGEASSRKMMARQVSDIFSLPLNDQEGTQTRLNEIETVAVVLCREVSGRQIVFLDGSEFIVEGKHRVLPVAQAIHKNMVQVADYHFDGKTCDSFSAFDPYLYGKYTVGIVGQDGRVGILRLSGAAYYNDDEGLVVQKAK